MSSLEKVVNLFMQENDKLALQELYQITNDDLIKKALNWRKEYKSDLESKNSSAFYMYEDVMSYIWEKYKLNEVKYKENEFENEIAI